MFDLGGKTSNIIIFNLACILHIFDLRSTKRGFLCIFINDLYGFWSRGSVRVGRIPPDTGFVKMQYKILEKYVIDNHYSNYRKNNSLIFYDCLKKTFFSFR